MHFFTYSSSNPSNKSRSEKTSSKEGGERKCKNWGSIIGYGMMWWSNKETNAYYSYINVNLLILTLWTHFVSLCSYGFYFFSWWKAYIYNHWILGCKTLHFKIQLRLLLSFSKFSLVANLLSLPLMRLRAIPIFWQRSCDYPVTFQILY